MKNSEKYNFDDFTIKNYRKLLQLAKQQYAFRSFTNFNKEEKFIIWRHDVDMSMHAARILARIEAEEGIQSTYCLLLHSEFYNLLEREIMDCAHDIFALGHHLGLHFDTTYYNLIEGDVERLNTYLLREKKLLEEVFNQKIHVFAFHNTTPLAISCEDWEYAGMINAYAKYFRKEVGYCSDSNGYWRFRRLKDVLEKADDKHIQILTHPVWWQEKVMSPKERIWWCIDSRAEKTKKWYQSILKEIGRKNIDW